MFPNAAELIRIDPLTGCKTFFGFLEDCMEPDPADRKLHAYTDLRISPNLIVNALQYSAVLFVSMNDISILNHRKGFGHGDSAIRWMGILLQEETGQPVYRLWGTEFAVFLQMDGEQENVSLLGRITERMNREAKLLEFPGAPAEIALIFNDQESICLDSLLMQMGEAMASVKNSRDLHQTIFRGSDLKIPAMSPHKWKTDNPTDISFAIRWITCASIYHVIAMGKRLEMAQQDAFTDPVSNLPNMKAALLKLEETLQNAKAKVRPFSILLIDGDNIRAYNLINYAAGDEMIRAMSDVFKQNLRPDDFVARWRTGDEFIVILPETTKESAKNVGERFRMAVKNASHAWRLPTTISTGIASYPVDGENIDTLIDKAEQANKRAKEQGKDRVVMAE